MPWREENECKCFLWGELVGSRRQMHPHLFIDQYESPPYWKKTHLHGMAFFCMASFFDIWLRISSLSQSTGSIFQNAREMSIAEWSSGVKFSNRSFSATGCINSWFLWVVERWWGILYCGIGTAGKQQSYCLCTVAGAFLREMISHHHHPSNRTAMASTLLSLVENSFGIGQCEDKTFFPSLCILCWHFRSSHE